MQSNEALKMASPMNYELPIGIEGILELLPHRYPFLFIDRVDELDPAGHIVGVKNLTMNEPFFQGHFPDRPVMPGVLILEAMAQLGSLFIKVTEAEEIDGKLLVFTGLDDAKFRRQVVPGDTLRIVLSEYKKKLRLFRMQGEAYVGSELACSAVIKASPVDF